MKQLREVKGLAGEKVMGSAELLFACLRDQVCGVALTQAEKESIASGGEELMVKLYTLAAAHDSAHIVCASMEAHGLLPQNELGQAFLRQKDIAQYRFACLSIAQEEISLLLEKEKIRYVSLKGAELRKLYPVPWMRTSCDIDVLVHPEELKRAITCLEVKGWKKENENFHDVSLHSPEGVNLELHFNLKETSDALDNVLERVWDYVVPVGETEIRGKMTGEFFFYHHLAHMSYHFVTGGCGIRPFLDTYLLLHKLSWDQEALDSLLNQGGIRQFGEKVIQLSEEWFTPGYQINDPAEKQILSYVLQGGVYGTKENHIRSQQARRGSVGKNVVNRIWLPYETLKNYYRSLEGKKYLLPLYEVRRWVRIIFKEKKTVKSVQELQSNLMVSDRERTEMQEIFSELGLTGQYRDA